MGMTIKDIALLAGVNQSTVSRSLNDSPLISEATKEKVKKIAEELNFEINANARSLNTKKTDTIGVIYPESMEEFRFSLYHNSLLVDLRTSLEKEELDTIVTFTRNRFTRTSNIKKLINRKKVDGLIIITPNLDVDEFQYIQDSGLPLVFLHYVPTFVDDYKLDLISTDDFHGGKIGTEHLINLGHKKIICLTEEDDFPQRTNGYKSALKEHKVKFQKKYILNQHFAFDGGYQSIMENKHLLDEATAIFAQTDLLALGAMKALKELGYSIPEDISVIGYDDSELGKLSVPQLTSVQQPDEKISKLACERLIRLINNKSKRKLKTYVKPTLTKRGSCGKNQRIKI